MEGTAVPLKRRRQRCKACGMIRKGHICPYKPQKKPKSPKKRGRPRKIPPSVPSGSKESSRTRKLEDEMSSSSEDEKLIREMSRKSPKVVKKPWKSGKIAPSIASPPSKPKKQQHFEDDASWSSTDEHLNISPWKKKQPVVMPPPLPEKQPRPRGRPRKRPHPQHYDCTQIMAPAHVLHDTVRDYLDDHDDLDAATRDFLVQWTSNVTATLTAQDILCQRNIALTAQKKQNEATIRHERKVWMHHQTTLKRLRAEREAAAQNATVAAQQAAQTKAAQELLTALDDAVLVESLKR